MIYVVTAPANKLDKKNRVSGWHFVPLDKRAKQEWRGLLAPLKGREVSSVISSDLDSEAANLAASELGVPAKTEYVYRRFNVGRYHAKPASTFDENLRVVGKKWTANPDIPVREGDSLSSYRKRFVKNFEKLLAKDGDSVFVTDVRTIAMIRDGFNPHSLIPNGNPVDTKKIFKVKKA